MKRKSGSFFDGGYGEVGCSKKYTFKKKFSLIHIELVKYWNGILRK